MRTLIYRSIRFTVAAAILLFVTTHPAHAQFGLGGVVYDPKNFAQAVLLYKRAYDQLVVARNQFAAQTTALRKLANPNWRDIGALMSQADALTQQGNALGYSLRTLDAAFQQTFPGPTALRDLSTYTVQQESQWLRTLTTMRSVLNATSHITQNLPNGLAQLRAIKQQMAGIQGHEEALELANTISAYNAEELALLRQQIAAQTNAQTVYFANEVNTRAEASANERVFLDWLAAAPARGRVISFQPHAP
jgi:P-type conjugative transfer protein TrbJ